MFILLYLNYTLINCGEKICTFRVHRLKHYVTNNVHAVQTVLSSVPSNVLVMQHQFLNCSIEKLHQLLNFSCILSVLYYCLQDFFQADPTQYVLILIKKHQYCGLNVCVSPSSYVEIQTPKNGGIRRWGL